MDTQVTYNAGEWYAYDSAAGLPTVKGMHGVACCYRSSDGKPAKRSNEFVLIPDYITDEEVLDNLEELLPYIKSYLQSVQDDKVKKAHASHESRIYTDYVNMANLLEHLEQIDQGARLTKEQIADWFTDTLKQRLISAFTEKMQGNEQLVTATVAQYQKKFESLAGGRTFIIPEDRMAMLKAIEVCGVEEDSLAKRFIKRLEKMDDRQQDTLASL